MVSRILPIVLATVIAGPVQAHALLEQANPKVGATIAASPAEVRMRFSEPLVAAFSSASILSPSGQAIDEGKAFVDPKDGRMLVVPIVHPLAPGRYRVKWAVVSADTHRTQGDFAFTVR